MSKKEGLYEHKCTYCRSGCSGLYTALNLPQELQITIITKDTLENSDSFLAQGGICMLKDDSDYESFFEDTLRAGHYKNDKVSVDLMIKSSPDVIEDLLDFGVDFQRDENGNLVFTREGAHSDKRILFYQDTTGKEITSRLLAAVKKRPNIMLMEHTCLLDILEEDNRCYGGVVRLENGDLEKITADVTVLASGGVGGLYKNSTNFKHLTGDALAISLKHDIELKDMTYVQVHPTTLYQENPKERSFLISESVRGEGALLYDKNMNRFVDELLPRDVVAQAILKQMEKDGTDHVWEDLRTIPKKNWKSIFQISWHIVVRLAMTHSQNVFLSCQRSIISWVELRLITTAKQPWMLCMRLVKQLVMVCMGKTVWQVIRCLKVSFLRNVRLKIWWLTMKQLLNCQKACQS